jgi:hypothetical protein
MKRANPFGSPAGFIFLFLFFVGLGVWLWRGRGLAFSPGEVSEKSSPGIVLKGYHSHAEFEKQCRLCHDPLNSTLAEKCVECHTDVGEQMINEEGLHGHMDLMAGCHTCHAAHRGREFNPSLAAQAFFDHSTTSFSLNWHQLGYDAQPLDCHSCHTGELTHGAPDAACTECHAQADAAFISTHQVEAGTHCQACHDGVDRMRNFDHASTVYTLEGKHANVDCAGCHVDGQMQGIPQVCQDCHEEPSAHQGVFEQDCAACHSPLGWKPVHLDGQTFDHTTTTAFSLNRHSLDYQDAPMNCKACHGASGRETASLQSCIDCHANADAPFMQDHQAQYGSACLDCHDGIDRMSGFVHDTVFVLDGKHFEAACQDCHTDAAGNPRFRNTPAECVQCHAEPQIHAGDFGLQCQYCHTATGWSPANLRLHTFPVGHGAEDGNPPADCQTCHPTNYANYTCYGCHEHQLQEIEASHDEAGITRQELPDCIACHLSGEIDD